MKKFLILMVLGLLGGAAFGSTMSDNTYLANNKMGATARKLALGDAIFGLDTDGLKASGIARATYDVAVDGGTVAAHGLGVYLPAKALIKQSWFYTVTQFVDGGAGTVALHCEDANNIYSAADITGIAVGAKTAGVQTGTAANMTGAIAAECELTATVATAAQTAGKLILFVEYVVIE